MVMVMGIPPLFFYLVISAMLRIYPSLLESLSTKLRIVASEITRIITAKKETRNALAIGSDQSKADQMARREIHGREGPNILLAIFPSLSFLPMMKLIIGIGTAERFTRKANFCEKHFHRIELMKKKRVSQACAIAEIFFSSPSLLSLYLEYMRWG